MANEGSRGFGFVSQDGADSVVVHWLVQADYTTFVGDKPPGVATRNTFTTGFAGLQLDTTLARIFRASFLADFSQSRLTLLDAFVEARVDAAFVVRVGTFPTPISEERLTPKFFLPWISTGPSSFLLPARELGAQIYGGFGRGVFQYNAALVNGSYAGAITDNDSDSYKDVMGRVFAHPFKTTAIAPLEKLGLGIGASAGDRVGSPGAPQTPLLRTYGNVPRFLVGTAKKARAPARPRRKLGAHERRRLGARSFGDPRCRCGARARGADVTTLRHVAIIDSARNVFTLINTFDVAAGLPYPRRQPTVASRCRDRQLAQRRRPRLFAGKARQNLRRSLHGHFHSQRRRKQRGCRRRLRGPCPAL